MKRREYEAEMAKLQGELVKLQYWVRHSGTKVCVVFEGRDAAGKGGVIKRITERTSPRVFRVVALPAPNDREKSQMYMQRYVSHFPSAGEIVLFDRSWYNRAGVERVMRFTPEADVKRFLEMTPSFEQSMLDAGIILIKYWLEVSEENQTARFRKRLTDPRRVWKLSPMDLESHKRWYDYSRARDEMFAATDTEAAPWFMVDSNDKRRARLNCISHLLSMIPYEDLPRPEVTIPPRQRAKGYTGPAHLFRYVPRRH
jgi:polyphosphate kinase 2